MLNKCLYVVCLRVDSNLKHAPSLTQINTDCMPRCPVFSYTFLILIVMNKNLELGCSGELASCLVYRMICLLILLRCFRTFQRDYFRCAANIHFEYLRSLWKQPVSILSNLQHRRYIDSFQLDHLFISIPNILLVLVTL